MVQLEMAREVARRIQKRWEANVEVLNRALQWEKGFLSKEESYKMTMWMNLARYGY
jgi:regulator of sirC expression with transglutaminase-like and TPR domain